MQSFLKKYWLEIMAHLLLWMLLFDAINSLTTLTMKYLPDAHQSEQGGFVKNSLYPLSYVLLFFLGVLFYTLSFCLFKIPGIRKNYYYIIVSLVFAAVAYFANYFLVKPFIILSTLNSAQWKAVQNNVLLIFGFVWGLSLAYCFSREWFRNELLQKKMESNQLSTELNFLKSQINPHFLFNTLNNFFSMAQEKENDELANGISKLSQMMRYMIYESNAEKVPLEKEIEYLKSCIVLNKLRFKESEAVVHFSYPQNCKCEMIAPMLFIPFVENAFKYGVLINKDSQIDMAIELSNSGILFSCKNNNYNFVRTMNNAAKGIGLNNVRRRLDLLYPGAYSLQITNENKKYSVLLQIGKK